MKKALFAFAAAAAVLAGCQMADDFAVRSDSKGDRTPLSVTASIENSETRALILLNGEGCTPVWQAGDRILIKGFVDSNEGNDYFTAAEGGAVTTYFNFFYGDTVNAGPYEAYSPANVSVAFPGVQSQDAGNVCKWVPMRAYNAETPNFQFKTLGGLLKLNIKTAETGIVVNQIIVTTDQPMAGKFTLDGDAAVIDAEGQKSITLDCGEGIAIGSTATPFFISVPANTYTGMTIQLVAANGKKSSVIKMKEGKSVKVERSKYYEADFAFDKFETVTTGGKALLPGGIDFNTTIKNLLLEGSDYIYKDHTVSKIIFETNSASTSGINIASLDSEQPVYLTLDNASGIVRVCTPASEFILPEDASYMFAYFGALEEIVNLKSLNTSNVMNMSYMFCLTGCNFNSLKSLDLSNFDTAKDTSMRSMFNGCSQIEKLDVSKFNTSSVESFNYMFQYCRKLKEIDCSNFDTKNALNLGYMFAYCNSVEKINITGFNTENVETVAGMFRNTEALQEIICEPMDLSNCTSVSYMFAYTGLPSFESDRYMKNTENVGSFSYMFQYAKCYTISFGKNFSTASVNTMDNMFSHALNVKTLDLSMFETSNMVSTTSSALRSFVNRCDALETLDMRNWELSGNISATYMFYGIGSIKDIYFGEGFIRTGSPDYMWGSKTLAPPYRTGSVNGAFNIHCTQDTADWLAKTTLRHVHSGATIGVPCDVHFLDLNGGNELTVTWAAD